jgi:hypothetical protein
LNVFVVTRWGQVFQDIQTTRRSIAQGLFVEDRHDNADLAGGCTKRVGGSRWHRHRLIEQEALCIKPRPAYPCPSLTQSLGPPTA